MLLNRELVMRRRRRIARSMSALILTLLAFLVPLTGQVRCPKQEFRAVWLTTVFGADWPGGAANPSDQRRLLAGIYDTLASNHFNAVIMQVRARGDLLYPSGYEPWAACLTGTLGKDPGYDPLQFAVDEAHRHGLEFHAWWNVCKVADANDLAVTTPLHVVRRHPEWIRTWKNLTNDGRVASTEYWLDMGLPEARAYLVDVVLEMVRRYDIDAVHFDYLRYPGFEFDDSATFARYGGGAELAEWRRDNLTKFVRAVHDSVVRIKPWVKVGSAPIGIYRNLPGASGWQGYELLSQDARRWMREGIIDYVAPQIYWGLENNPRFGILAADWIKNAYGRHTYLGIGAYRPEVISEIGRIIDTSRSLGGLGQSYFRYQNVCRDSVIAGEYTFYSLMPPMPWKDGVPPQPPLALSGRVENGTSVRLTWQPPERAGDGEIASRFVLYRLGGTKRSRDDASAIRWVSPRTETSFLDDLSRPDAVRYTYCVTSLDRLGNESGPSNTVAVLVPRVAKIAKVFDVGDGLAEPVSTGRDILRAAYQVSSPGRVRLEVRDAGGNSVREVAGGFRSGGEYVVGVTLGGLPQGFYTLTLVTDSTAYSRRFVVGK